VVRLVIEPTLKVEQNLSNNQRTGEQCSSDDVFVKVRDPYIISISPEETVGNLTVALNPFSSAVGVRCAHIKRKPNPAERIERFKHTFFGRKSLTARSVRFDASERTIKLIRIREALPRVHQCNALQSALNIYSYRGNILLPCCCGYPYPEPCAIEPTTPVATPALGVRP
jgi:hypothetical protein